MQAPAESATAMVGVGPRLDVAVVAAANDATFDLFDAIAQMGRVIAGVEAMRARAIDTAIQLSALSMSDPASASGRDLRLRSLRAELACAMRIPERTAERMMHASETLVHQLPSTLDALSSGQVSYRHAQVMVDETATLEPDAARAVESAALPFAESLTVAKFARRLRMLRERQIPGSMVERHEAEAERREVTFTPARDGMAWLSAYLPAADALGAFNRLTDMASSLRGPDEPRTLTQLRADLLVHLLHDGELPAGCGVARGIRPTVQVTVPVLVLLGKDLPAGAVGASLEGYGPIDEVTARRLAGSATSFIRLLTHPETGAVLSVGQDRYAVPADLKNWLRLRDGTCRFPGCSQTARRCDIDHTEDWAHGGGTDYDNLAHLCRGHHTLKHKTGWSVRNDRGTLTWTSPSGHNHITTPEIHLRT